MLIGWFTLSQDLSEMDKMVVFLCSNSISWLQDLVREIQTTLLPNKENNIQLWKCWRISGSRNPPEPQFIRQFWDPKVCWEQLDGVYLNQTPNMNNHKMMLTIWRDPAQRTDLDLFKQSVIERIIPSMATPKITLYFDLGSPFACIAFHALRVRRIFQKIFWMGN